METILVKTLFFILTHYLLIVSSVLHASYQSKLTDTDHPNYKKLNKSEKQGMSFKRYPVLSTPFNLIQFRIKRSHKLDYLVEHFPEEPSIDFDSTFSPISTSSYPNITKLLRDISSNTVIIESGMLSEWKISHLKRPLSSLLKQLSKKMETILLPHIFKHKKDIVIECFQTQIRSLGSNSKRRKKHFSPHFSTFHNDAYSSGDKQKDQNILRDFLKMFMPNSIKNANDSCYKDLSNITDLKLINIWLILSEKTPSNSLVFARFDKNQKKRMHKFEVGVPNTYLTTGLHRKYRNNEGVSFYGGRPTFGEGYIFDSQKVLHAGVDISNVNAEENRHPRRSVEIRCIVGRRDASTNSVKLDAHQ
ncbi:hypothetical protein OAB57_00035 [Bacteriovoracaceae bacterium]|nr:hypothetical protein [Bacteriovoracaceae bacterium]